MTVEADPRRWKLLGERLRQRREDIDPAYRNRAEWIRSGSRGVSASVARDIENGNRANYDDPTIRAIEVAYKVVPGSVPAFLAGDDDALVPVRSVTPFGAVSVLQHLSGTPGPDAVDVDDMEDAIDLIEDLRARTEFRRKWRTVWKPVIEQVRREQARLDDGPGKADGVGA
jgi:hypothetical protein